MASEVEAGFAAVEKALAPYATAHGFVSYTKLSAADTRRLAQAIDAGVTLTLDDLSVADLQCLKEIKAARNELQERANTEQSQWQAGA